MIACNLYIYIINTSYFHTYDDYNYNTSMYARVLVPQNLYIHMYIFVSVIGLS